MYFCIHLRKHFFPAFLHKMQRERERGEERERDYRREIFIAKITNKKIKEKKHDNCD